MSSNHSYAAGTGIPRSTTERLNAKQLEGFQPKSKTANADVFATGAAQSGKPRPVAEAAVLKAAQQGPAGAQPAGAPARAAIDAARHVGPKGIASETKTNAGAAKPGAAARGDGLLGTKKGAGDRRC